MEYYTKEKSESIVVNPELKLGWQLTKWFAIEAGGTYKKYFGDMEKWEIRSNDLDGFGTNVSFVARIPLN